MGRLRRSVSFATRRGRVAVTSRPSSWSPAAVTGAQGFPGGVSVPLQTAARGIRPHDGSQPPPPGKGLDRCSGLRQAIELEHRGGGHRPARRLEDWPAPGIAPGHLARCPAAQTGGRGLAAARLRGLPSRTAPIGSRRPRAASAMANQVPVIASSAGALPNRGQTGIIVPKRMDAIADALQRLRRPGARAALGTRAAPRAERVPTRRSPKDPPLLA
jgi:hypothetical protein